MIEVSDKKLMKKINTKRVETTVEKMHPFAYTLVSKKGIILERLSHNLIADTEFKPIMQLLEDLHSLTTISAPQSSWEFTLITGLQNVYG